ncbi:MAG: hypothetical protein AB7T06_41170 [Kofleriaceae bacterium]
MADFVLLGADSDETRLLLDRATGYSVSLPGHPVMSVPSQDARPRYDVTVTLRDVAVEHGFRIDEVPAATEPNELARAFATAYAKNRAPTDAKLTIKPIIPRLRPGTTGGGQGVYPLRDVSEPMMEQIWVTIRPAPSGFWALYHTSRFRNADVNVLRWAHVRASVIDQHHWDPDRPRSEAAQIWPTSTFALPSVTLDLTESAWSEAQAKARDMGVLTREQTMGFANLLREAAQTDEPPKATVLPPTIQIFTSRIAMHGPTQAAEAVLRNLDHCKNMLDLRGWAWQCAWAIGNRHSLNASTTE